MTYVKKIRSKTKEDVRKALDSILARSGTFNEVCILNFHNYPTYIKGFIYFN